MRYMDTIFDYVRNPILIIPSHFQNTHETRSKIVAVYFETRKNVQKIGSKFNSTYNPVDSQLLYIILQNGIKLFQILIK